MTTPMIDPDVRAETARRKALRRRHLLQRQTIIFGSIIALLALAAATALGVYLDVLPPPFDREFTDTSAEESEATIVPCPPEGALPVEYNTITANVYNGGETAGLAGNISTALGNTGVLIARIENYPQGYSGAGAIITGTTGVTAAYTLLPLFPGATIELDRTRTDATVDVVLGDAFEEMADPEAVKLDPATPLVGIEGCTPYADIPTTTTQENPQESA